jgi:hypothetical protein
MGLAVRDDIGLASLPNPAPPSLASQAAVCMAAGRSGTHGAARSLTVTNQREPVWTARSMIPLTHWGVPPDLRPGHLREAMLAITLTVATAAALLLAPPRRPTA